MWSSPFPTDCTRPIAYVDLTGGVKPHTPTASFHRGPDASGWFATRPEAGLVHRIRHHDTSVLDGGQVRRAWCATLIAAADRSEVSPSAALAQLDRLWHRSATGGAVAVFRSAEEQARIEYVGCDLFAIPCFRQAVRTVLLARVEHFRERSVLRVVPHHASDECHYHVQWS